MCEKKKSVYNHRLQHTGVSLSTKLQLKEIFFRSNLPKQDIFGRKQKQ